MIFPPKEASLGMFGIVQKWEMPSKVKRQSKWGYGMVLNRGSWGTLSSDKPIYCQAYSIFDEVAWDYSNLSEWQIAWACMPPHLASGTPEKKHGLTGSCGRFIMNRGRDCFRNFTKNIGSWNMCVQKYHEISAQICSSNSNSSHFITLFCMLALWGKLVQLQHLAPAGNELDWNIIIMKWPGWNPFESFEIQASHGKMLRQHGHPLVVTCCEYAIDFGPVCLWVCRKILDLESLIWSCARLIQ